MSLYGPVQSDPVWHGPVQSFVHEFKTTLHIYVPNWRVGGNSSSILVNMVF